MWYDEANLLHQIEERLGYPIEVLSPDFKLPPHMSDLSLYGQRAHCDSTFKNERMEVLQPSIEQLAGMETSVQHVWLESCIQFSIR